MGNVFCELQQKEISIFDAPFEFSCIAECEHWKDCEELFNTRKARDELKKRIDTYKASVEAGKKINLDEMHSFCNKIDRLIKENRKDYDINLLLNSQVEQGKSFIVYIFDEDKPCKIGHSKNLVQYTGTELKRFTGKRFGIGYEAVPDETIEYVVPTLLINNNLSLWGIIRPSNPIYISFGQLKKASREVYGIDLRRLKKILDLQAIDITEFDTGEDLIYIKPEIDDIIRETVKASLR